jgi:DNA polymerase III delta prime subunit
MIERDAYILAGPTASGKTALAVALAKRLDGEVIWYNEGSACVSIPLPDGGEKDYFFDAAEVTE